MANVNVGSISATFQARNEQFLRASRQNIKAMQQQQRAFRQTGEAARRSTTQVRQFSTALAGAFSVAAISVAARGVTRLTKAASEYGATLVENSRRTGILVSELELLGRVFEADGTTATQFTRAIKTLQRAITDGQDGLTTYVRAFNRLGIDINSNEFALLNTAEIIDLISDRISNLVSTTQQSGVAQAIFGRGGIAILATLQRTSAGIAAERARQARLISPLIEAEAAQLKALNQSYIDLANVIKTQVRRSISGVAEELISLNTQLIELAPRIIRPITQLLDAFARNFDSITFAIKALVGFLAASTAFRFLGFLAGTGGGVLVRRLGLIAGLVGGFGLVSGDLTLPLAGTIGGGALGGIAAFGRSAAISFSSAFGAVIARLIPIQINMAFRLLSPAILLGGGATARTIASAIFGGAFGSGGTLRAVGLGIARGIAAGIRGGIKGAAVGAIVGGLTDLFFQQRIAAQFAEAIDKDNREILDQLALGLQRYEEQRERLSQGFFRSFVGRNLGLGFINDRRLEIELNQVERLLANALRTGAIEADDLVGNLAPLSIIAQEADLIPDAIDKALDATGALERLFDRILGRITDIQESLITIGDEVTANLQGELAGIQNTKRLQEAQNAFERSLIRLPEAVRPINEEFERLEEQYLRLKEEFEALPLETQTNLESPVTRDFFVARELFQESQRLLAGYIETTSRGLLAVEELNSAIILANARTNQALLDSTRFLDDALRQAEVGLNASLDAAALFSARGPESRAAARLAPVARSIITERARLRTLESDIIRQLANQPTEGPQAGEAFRVGLEQQLIDVRAAQELLRTQGPEYLASIENIFIKEENILANSTNAREEAIRSISNLASTLQGFDFGDFVQSGVDQINQFNQRTGAIGLSGTEAEAYNFRLQAQNQLIEERRRLLEQAEDAGRQLNQAVARGDQEAIASSQERLALARALYQQFLNDLPQAIRVVQEQSQTIFDAAETREQIQRLADIARGVGNAFGDFAGSIIRNFNNIGEAARRLGQTIVDNLIKNLIATPISNFFTQALGGIIPGLQSGGLGRGLTLVGEGGPELVDFRRPGRVYSNRDLSNALERGGGGNVFNFAPVVNSSDPAAVNRAIAESYPIFERRVLSTIQQDSRRSSSLRRSLRGG